MARRDGDGGEHRSASTRAVVVPVSFWTLLHAVVMLFIRFMVIMPNRLRVCECVAPTQAVFCPRVPPFGVIHSMSRM